VETGRYARDDCPTCHGKGRVKIGAGSYDWAVCPCAIAGQRMAVAELRITEAFPARAQQMTISSYDAGGLAQNERALKVARRFIDNYEKARQEGWMIGFFGNPNAGKTHLAVAIARAVLKRYDASVHLLNFPQMLHETKERWRRKRGEEGEDPIEAAVAADLLVLDDLGAQYERDAGSEAVTWVAEQLYMILDARIMANRPTIYTTNLQPSVLQQRLNTEAGKRILSRIERAEVGKPIELMPVQNAGRQDEEAVALLFGD
jgi:DNA replication protein DnaC